MMSLHLRTRLTRNVKNINTWIELAMIRRVENLSLELDFKSVNYTFSDSFYIQSSLKELSLRSAPMIPTCSVSWTSFKKFSLRNCTLSDAFLATILSGCPVLESLTLYFCDDLTVVDLSNSPSLTTLEVQRNFWAVTSMQIVAPHIRCLRLINSHLPSTLVDVSSLAEAKLNICYGPLCTINGKFLEVKVLMMVESLQNVEKLTFGKEFLEFLSLPKLLGVDFPTLKVKYLTLETTLHEYVIPPGIERLLQNSPHLKKLHIRDCNTKPGVRRSKSRWGAESEHVATFMELMFKNIKTLEKMVVRVEDCYLEARGFKEMVQTLSHNNNNNVSIVASVTRLNHKVIWS